jgi:hypothetical protein
MRRSKLEKQQQAEDRNKARSKRSPQDQISRLDSIFGAGLGATKERTRLQKIIEGNIEKQESSEKKKKNKKIKQEI